MKKILLGIISIFFVLGCARLSVQGAKEPIKLDISMRLDIYQHVEKDIADIEDIVSGNKTKEDLKDKQSFLGVFMSNAYAQESFSPEVEQSALRRKARVGELYSYESSGVVGENKMGLLELRDASRGTSAINDFITAENNDRMVIYKAIAAKNNTPVEEVQKIYAKRLKNDAPSGTSIEVVDQNSGVSEWKMK